MWPNTVLRRQRPARGGYTLIELLVVVMIVLILIAATLPVAKRVMENSKPREASRQLNAHLAMARAYAARNRRPFGLWMEYNAPVGEVDPASGPTLRQVTRIYLAEVQPPYAGGTTTARGIIRVPSGQSLAEFVPLLASDADSNPGEIDPDLVEPVYLRTLIGPGETFLVKFDFKGDWYRCMRGISTNGAGYTDPNRFYYLGPASSSVWPPAYNTPSSLGFRYQILRQPRRVGNPLEMPVGTCVDIEHSGMGPTGYDTPGVDVTVDGGFGEATSRLIVLFQPSGGIDGLYVDNQAIVPTGTLHFLVGRVDKVFLPTGVNSAHPSGFNAFALETSNLADPNNVWVSVGRLNGSITSSENMPDSEHGTLHPNPWTAAGQAEYLEECRQVATGREQMGGQ